MNYRVTNPGIMSLLEAEPYAFAHYLAEQVAQPNTTIRKMRASGTPDGKVSLPLNFTRIFFRKQRHASSIGSSYAEVPRGWQNEMAEHNHGQRELILFVDVTDF
jgi:hypothetical protein